MNKFLKFSTWKSIIQSRTIDYKNSKTSWCKERREICRNCEYNSKNVNNLRIKDRILMFLQITKEICTACGCSLKAKTRNAFSSCGLTEINEVPKWTRINIKK